MAVLKLIVTIIQLILGVALILVVLFQSGKSSGLSGAIGGGSDSYSFKAKSKTWEAKLARWTKWIALAFVVLTFVLNLL
ncbi:MAG: preprotein translocase subunit SecG [Oscillospiraceae bacterium]|nr:preprotein translocase subunit SecG [Oscillospiraceae bacterium]MBR5262033.1 preprotein translocase subunit SecG [Oscillospiraceae bacterium]